MANPIHRFNIVDKDKRSQRKVADSTTELDKTCVRQFVGCVASVCTEESVRLRTRDSKAKMEYSDTFWNFSSLQRVQHQKLLTPPEVRRLAPVHMQYGKFFLCYLIAKDKNSQNV